MSETGEHLETVRILNDRAVLAEVMSRAGESPEVVLEATYGWYWAADALAELGATVHLAHPLGVKAFSYRRVKNDQRDASDLSGLGHRDLRCNQIWDISRSWPNNRSGSTPITRNEVCMKPGMLQLR